LFTAKRANTPTFNITHYGLQVALKVVNVTAVDGPTNPDNVLFKGFLKELKILHQLGQDCQNTCRVHGYTVLNGKPGIVLKLYKNGDLQGVLDRGKSSSWEF
jgi:hypothetical protein